MLMNFIYNGFVTALWNNLEIKCPVKYIFTDATLYLFSHLGIDIVIIESQQVLNGLDNVSL